MDRRKILEAILKNIEYLIKNDVLVIVEGKKDAKAMRSLGIGKIKVLDTRYKTIESIEDKEVALLVDLDRQGKKIYAELKDMLSKRGVRVEDKFRCFLFKETKVRQIEALDRFVGKLKDGIFRKC